MVKTSTRPSNSTTRTVAYLRVSTDKQADDGCSLDVQRAHVEAYARLYGLELVEVIVDAGQSAKSLDRPGLTKALAMLGRGTADALLVAKLDRLTRSVRDLGTLVEGPLSRCALLSVGEQIDTRSAGGRLVLNVLASVSQWEREAIGERTSAAKRYQRAQGEFTGGGAPYGYTVSDGALVEVEAEQRAMRLARQWRGEGESFGRIARRLERAGIVSRTGRTFAPIQVSRMIGAVEAS